jgi:CMP-N-acetylneuraminic acid synthetase
MSAVCVIPARGGSRRIEHKNRKLFHGKPIIVYSIETAKASGLFDMIVVSTDDLEIADIAITHGVGVVPRDAEMSKDEIGTQEVTRHALEWCQWAKVDERPEYTCCVYPCAPMMTVSQLCFGFSLIAEPPMIAPPETYAYIPGWFYWGRTSLFLGDIPLPPAGSIKIPDNWIDINTPSDWSEAEKMYAALHPEAT